MHDTVLRLFGVRPTATHAVPVAEGRLAAPLASGRLILREHADAPVSVLETPDGPVVVGSRTAVFLSSDGNVSVRPLGEAKVLPTTNKEWGFFGTVLRSIEPEDHSAVTKVWDEASKALAKKYPDYGPEKIRTFLDSRGGRHFADQVTNAMPAPSDPEAESKWTTEQWIAGVRRTVQTVSWLKKEIARGIKGAGFGESKDDGLDEVKFEEGDRVKVTGNVDGKGETGTISDVAPSGHFFGVKQGKKFLGYYHESDLKPAPGEDEAVDESHGPIARLRALHEDHGDMEMFFNVTDFARAQTGRMGNAEVEALQRYITDHPVWQRARVAAEKLIRSVIVKEPDFKALLDEYKLKLKESTMPTMKPALREEDYAEIVFGDDGLDLLVNGTIAATETCDLEDMEACARAERQLCRQAEALGYVAEGTFDASNEKGGAVVNGDEQDDYSRGESYYSRRYRRRTSDSATGKPTMPALETWLAMSADERIAFLAERHGVETKQASLMAAIVDEYTGDPKTFETFLAKLAECDDEDEDDEEDDDEEDDEEADEARLIALSADFLAENLDADLAMPSIREFDELVAEGDYEGAVTLAEMLAETMQVLDEYKRRTGSSLSKFRRSMKTRTAAEKVRNRGRRKAYKTNAGMRRTAKRYRIRTKRFIRARRKANESAELDERTYKPVTKKIAEKMKADGARFAVWSTDKDVTFHRSLADAQKEIKANPESVDPDMDGRTWTDIDELIDVLEAVRCGAALAEAKKRVHENYTDDTFKDSIAGKAGADATFLGACASVMSGLSGETIDFVGLSASLKASGYVGEASEVMRALSYLVNTGTVEYTRGEGYRMPVRENEANLKLAKGARLSGKKAVVTLAGTNIPTFHGSMQDAADFWKSLTPKLRGMKASIGNYMRSLGDETAEVEAEEEAVA